MPKLVARVPKYGKHKSSGQAVVQFGGSTYYLGPYGSEKSVREYDRLIAEYLVQGRGARGPKDEPPTVVELTAAFLDHATKREAKVSGLFSRSRSSCDRPETPGSGRFPRWVSRAHTMRYHARCYACGE